MRRSFLLSLMSAALLAWGPGVRSQELPIVFQSNFDGGALDRWSFSDAQSWKLAELEKGKALELASVGKYQPKVRSPQCYALIKDVSVTDFVLDVRMKSTSKDEPHRDLCLFFGYQDPEHFYYIHLGKRADPHAHSVFLVNDKPRVSIATQRTDGTPWTDGWHDVRLVRRVRSGDILVYFDDFERPVMRAIDTTFVWGRVGVGSFDNTGLFDDLVLRGKAMSAKAN